MPDEVLKYLRRTSGRILRRRAIEAAGLGVIVGGLVAAAGQIAFWMAGRPHRAAGIMILAAGLLGGVIVALIKGVSPRQTARYIDKRAALDERLTTAVELAGAGDVSPAAQCVYAQAAEAARSPAAAGVNLWVRGRATAAGAMLAVLLCGALVVLPQRRSVEERIVDALVEMSPEAVKALAEELARAARAADANAPLLERAARATRQRDARALADILDDLRRRGVRLVRIVRPDVLALATAGGSDANGSADTRPATAPSTGSSRYAGGPVHVWDPLYERFTAGRASTTQRAGTEDPPPVVSYEDAWSAARLRAAGALRTSSIPPEYRRMVRDFFSDRP
ncbi:MAG: hypothetical protein QGG42_17815 [Phycisphaerae bacterium]|jgi:hypothetical protein|nr:hypothetical protein [Phycisphaerae bacterium]